jgi:iron complex transport system permease protein
VSDAIRPAALRTSWIVGAAGLLLGAGLAGVLVGPVELGAKGILLEIADRLPLIDVSSGLSERETAILWELRAPRVVLGGLVGATLALAGAAYQGVFRNPLADPWLLGAAAGAGLGATLAIAYLPGFSDWAVDPVPLAAFAGALLGVAATYALGRSAARSRTATTLVLAGVAMASFLTALQTYVQQREADTLQQVYAWILGQLGTAGWDEVRLILPYVVVSGAAILLHRRLLDVLSVGDEEADALGVSSARIRLLVVIAASLGTAAAVAVSGLIAFVGIIVPHTVRLLLGSSYRVVLPLSVIFGAAFLVLTDLAARTAIAPAELPIGVITAFLGAPFFMIVLRRARGVV